MQAKKINVLLVLLILILSSLSCRFPQTGGESASGDNDIAQDVVTVDVATLPVEESGAGRAECDRGGS